MSTRIPHLLTPYLPLPPASLTLLTSVLGATTNWLLLRYLAFHLAPRTADDDEPANLRRRAPADDEGLEAGDTAVVLVSFMRDYAFWKDGAARLVCPSMQDKRRPGYTLTRSTTGARPRPRNPRLNIYLRRRPNLPLPPLVRGAAFGQAGYPVPEAGGCDSGDQHRGGRAPRRREEGPPVRGPAGLLSGRERRGRDKFRAQRRDPLPTRSAFCP